MDSTVQFSCIHVVAISCLVYRIGFLSFLVSVYIGLGHCWRHYSTGALSSTSNDFNGLVYFPVISKFSRFIYWRFGFTCSDLQRCGTNFGSVFINLKQWPLWPCPMKWHSFQMAFNSFLIVPWFWNFHTLFNNVLALKAQIFRGVALTCRFLLIKNDDLLPNGIWNIINLKRLLQFLLQFHDSKIVIL